MKIPDFHFTGLNVCKQVGNHQSDIIWEFTRIDIKALLEIENCEIEQFHVSITTYFGLFAVDETLHIISNLLENGAKKIKFSDPIISISAVDTHCLILLANGNLFKYDFSSNDDLKKIEFAEDFSSPILSVCAGNAFSSCYDKFNDLFNIPTKIHTFASHEKIKKMELGAEHGILLTTNGDCYTWGCGLRGQLGHGGIEIENQPKLVEALAGVKIVDVSASGFHSHAVSSFGDHYSFGWNTHGQLGIPTVQNLSLENFKSNSQSVFSVPQLTEMDEESSFTHVFSGWKHSILKTDNGRFFACGSNKYGQLGIPPCDSSDFKFHKTKDDILIDKFVEIKNEFLRKSSKIVTGDWCTITLNYE